MSAGRWHILSGEYPPQEGGVADYSARLAAGLAARGAEVDVWTTGNEGAVPEGPGVTVHRRAGRWSRADLERLGAALDTFETPRRLIVQYTPNAWGFKSLNLGFCRWLVARHNAGDVVRVMFHELFHYFKLSDRPALWLLPPVHRRMLRTVLRACSEIDVSTLEWARLLNRYPEVGPRNIRWLPVPSNIPVSADADEGAEVRAALAPSGAQVVGHFGTFFDYPRRWLRAVLPMLLRGRPDRIGLLIGRHGPRFAAELTAACPDLARRLIATGPLDPPGVSAHLLACDLLVQPYPDGICSRRGTAMAGLAHGRPIAATRGRFTEPVWAEGVALAPIREGPEGLARLAERLLADPAARDRLGAEGRRLYERRFALEHTIEAILGAMPCPDLARNL